MPIQILCITCKWIKGVSKIIKDKLINTEVPDKLENIEILEIDENKG